MLSGLSTAKSVYIRWFKLPKTWFDESGYATMVFDSKEQKKEKLMGISMSRHFEILYRLIGKFSFKLRVCEFSGNVFQEDCRKKPNIYNQEI